VSARLTQSEINTGWWAVNCCQGKYRGSLTSHCPTCHETFTSPSGFDRHRYYGKCLDPTTALNKQNVLIFRPAGREYACWEFNQDNTSR
jgi:hypothetical protein